MTAPGDLEGGRAPDFSGTTDTGETLKFSSLRGKTVVLFFYPKDDTSGCTTEACSLRDTLPRFTGLDAVVIGVSPDSPKSHQKFKKKYDLPYTLIADVDHAIAVKYGVWGEKSLYGRKYMGILRTTFLIDPRGTVTKVFEKVKPEGHGDEVAKLLAAEKTRG